MPFDPCQRLQRPLPGQRFLVEEEWVQFIFERGEESQVKEMVPRRDLQGGRGEPKLRGASRLGQPTPNAPALIRLVRHPYRLHPVRPGRKSYLEKQETRPERVDWQKEVREALAEWEVPRISSPTQQRPHPFAILPSRWKLLPGEER